MAVHATPQALATLTLLLHATIPSARHTQLLHILTGLCGHPPIQTLERHLLFRPVTDPTRRIAADEGGGQQNVIDKEKAKRRAEREARERGGRRGFVRYVEEVEVNEDTKEGGDGLFEEDDMDVDTPDGTAKREAGRSQWSSRFYDTPDPTVRAVTARKSEILDLGTDVRSVDDALKMAEDQGYRYVTQYLLTGSRFVHNNIVLLLYQPLIPNPTEERPANVELRLASLEAMKPLDEGSAYVLETRLELLDRPGHPPGNDLISQAVKELNNLKETMNGCVELKAVDRMSLNTRIG